MDRQHKDHPPLLISSHAPLPKFTHAPHQTKQSPLKPKASYISILYSPRFPLRLRLIFFSSPSLPCPKVNSYAFGTDSDRVTSALAVLERFSSLKTKSAGASKRTSKKAGKDPNKPKRPASAFFVFMEDFREKYKKEHPNNKSVAADEDDDE
ncbi:HMG1/2-like protein isoform X1 [Prunus yedoensis var. nudiflora]|uniref:HMG1/2-like protein isoform X1 n=1 Tax=Prunus yedoensis var. nudiflora TaxID=2094558 RepID=A0A314YB20_PRUYE|nr:HMG1/2-like protein isoform X1 [Prunus yedoensis var. nudiflora]